MGLDVTAYSKLVACDPKTDVEIDEAIRLYVVCEEHRPRAEGLAPGFYDCEGESFGFPAGAYSNYNRFRENLAALVGTTPEAVWDGKVPPAFGELIHFSDCEGYIGPIVSAKLAKDFAAWQERAESFAPTIRAEHDRAQFVERYRRWRKAFELASDGGAVQFH